MERESKPVQKALADWTRFSGHRLPVHPAGMDNQIEDMRWLYVAHKALARHPGHELLTIPSDCWLFSESRPVRTAWEEACVLAFWLPQAEP